MPPPDSAPLPSGQQDAKFDAVAEDYSDLHQQSIQSSGEDIDYFARYKLDRLLRAGAQGPILDYGCGIGNLTHHLETHWQEVHGYDPSKESLRQAQQRVPGGHFTSQQEELPKQHFASAVMAGVLHHISPPERDATLSGVLDHLRPGGRLYVFEHNPLNPLTRKAVAECPFDDDAILLWPRELRRRLRQAGFQAVQLDYIVFFPRALAPLRPLEPHMGRIALGAQTLTVGTKAG